MPVSGRGNAQAIRFDDTPLGRRVAAAYQARCDERDEARAEVEHLRKSIRNSDRDHWYAEAERLAEQLDSAIIALGWIADYYERDGRRTDDPSEAKSCIARNWLDAHPYNGKL